MRRNFRCWAEINLEALRDNAAVARASVGANVGLLGVIKANGYGHGLKAVAHALAPYVDSFGVANCEEATDARKIVDHPILILGPALPEERSRIVRHGFIPCISTSDEAEAFARVGKGSAVSINFVVDTGMGRIGVSERQAIPTLCRIATMPAIRLHSVSTHLPVADENEAFTHAQLERFTSLVSQIRAEVPGDYKVHALLSAGVFAVPEFAFDFVRAGLMLYGISPLPDFQYRLSPALTLKARVALIRETSVRTAPSDQTPLKRHRIALITAGYADGFPRGMRNGEILIRGSRCVVNAVAADVTEVDITRVPGAQVGDEAVLIGRQDQGEVLASEVATKASTIAWEILSRISTRVPRVYFDRAHSRGIAALTPGLKVL